MYLYQDRYNKHSTHGVVEVLRLTESHDIASSYRKELQKNRCVYRQKDRIALDEEI